jgi:PAS domain S-box
VIAGRAAPPPGLALLRATLEATADAILVVDRAGNITAFNRRFAELWDLPEGILASGDDSKAVAQVLGQLKDPAGFVARIEELYARPRRRASTSWSSGTGGSWSDTRFPSGSGTRSSAG